MAFPAQGTTRRFEEKEKPLCWRRWCWKPWRLHQWVDQEDELGFDDIVQVLMWSYFCHSKVIRHWLSLMIELLQLTGWWSFDHELCLIYHSFFNRSFVSLLLNFCFIKHQFYTNPRGNALSFLSSIILVQYRPLTWS